MTNVCGGRKWNHLPSRGLLSRNWENNHGTEIFEESVSQGQARDERAQGRDSEERPVRSQGQGPQAGDRDRSFRGEGGRQEGPEEGLEKKEELQEAEVEKIAHSKLYFIMAGLDLAIAAFPPAAHEPRGRSSSCSPREAPADVAPWAASVN